MYFNSIVSPVRWKGVRSRGYDIRLMARKCQFMGLLPDTLNGGLWMCRECRERFPRHRLQRKPLVSDPGMHHSTCVTHVLWCISGSLIRGGRENVPGIPTACATPNFTYLVRGPWTNTSMNRLILAMVRTASPRGRTSVSRCSEPYQSLPCPYAMRWMSDPWTGRVLNRPNEYWVYEVWH